MVGFLEITQAYDYAAKKHIFQKRKGVKGIPYINHPIEVANLISHSLSELDVSLLVAAILHDTIEDTDASEEEITQLFGKEVSNLVMEVSDDMTLPKKKRKEIQISKAHLLSDKAKQIKIADKTCNILDILTTRLEWTRKMKIDYVRWAIEVIDGCRGVNLILDNEFDKAVRCAREVLGELK
jgi:GTP diphosphokinase / guanosine-3',5'-bis(diphosphate) 3'-diphosphatase